MIVKVNKKRVFGFGLLVILIDQIIGNLFYQNPWIAGIYAKFSTHPTMKSFEAFGGLGSWLGLIIIFSIIFCSFLIFLFILLYNCIPGKGWLKGLFFGLFVGLIKAVPEAFNQWTFFVYPELLILIQLVNTIIGITLFGIILSLIFHRFKVIEVEA